MVKKSEIINTAKDIISEKYDIAKSKIADDISFRDRLLKFDVLDKYELLMTMEERFKIFVEATETQPFERSKTLSEFCDIFYRFSNPEISKIKTKNDVFKVLNNHLQNKYYIMNAKPSDNFFIDLHFNDINRSELMEWAEETFNIKLPRTYFLNLDDFCDNILKCLPKKETVKQHQNKIKMFFTKIYQRIK